MNSAQEESARKMLRVFLSYMHINCLVFCLNGLIYVYSPRRCIMQEKIGNLSLEMSFLNVTSSW